MLDLWQNLVRSRPMTESTPVEYPLVRGFDKVDVPMQAAEVSAPGARVPVFAGQLIHPVLGFAGSTCWLMGH